MFTSSGMAHTSPLMLTALTMGSKKAGKPSARASVSGTSSPLFTKSRNSPAHGICAMQGGASAATALLNLVT